MMILFFIAGTEIAYQLVLTNTTEGRIAGPTVITNTARFKFPLATGGFKVLEKTVGTPALSPRLYLPLIVR